jgi:hypothetical protein
MEVKKNNAYTSGNRSVGRDKLKDRRLSRRNDEPISWNSITSGTIASLVQSATAIGGCAILGTTSDGGALSVTVIVGDDRIREYPRTDDEVAELARQLAEEYA